MHTNPEMYIHKINLSGTSISVVKIRTADPTSENDHEISDNWPVCPCLKLVMIWGMRAKRPKRVLMMGTRI